MKFAGAEEPDVEASWGVEYHSIDPTARPFTALTGKPAATMPPFAERAYGKRGELHRLDVDRPDHLAPLLGFGAGTSSDVPALLAYVGYRWTTGKHLLGLSLTGFDP